MQYIAATNVFTHIVRRGEGFSLVVTMRENSAKERKLGDNY